MEGKQNRFFEIPNSIKDRMKIPQTFPKDQKKNHFRKFFKNIHKSRAFKLTYGSTRTGVSDPL